MTLKQIKLDSTVLGELVKITKGKKYAEQSDGKNRYITIDDLHRGDSPKYTDDDGVSCKPNDVLIAWDGANAGKVGVGFTGVIGSTLAKLVIIDKRIESGFLYWHLEANSENIKSQRTGATIPHVNGTALKNIGIPLPSLPTQHRIAEILDKADALRKKNKQLLQYYDDLAESLFIDMFGDPVKNEKGWETKTIEQIVKKEKHSIKRGPFGGALKKEIFVNEGYLVYEQYHALNNDFTFGRYYITEKKYEELIVFNVKPGDIIISCSGVYLGKLAILPKGSKPGIINQALLKLTLDNRVYSNELFIKVFTNKNFKEKYLESDRGAAIPNFPPMTTFKEFRFIAPPIEVQKRFNQQIKNLEQQKEKLKTQMQDSENLFQALLQKAFNGGLN